MRTIKAMPTTKWSHPQHHISISHMGLGNDEYGFLSDIHEEELDVVKRDPIKIKKQAARISDLPDSTTYGIEDKILDQISGEEKDGQLGMMRAHCINHFTKLAQEFEKDKKTSLALICREMLIDTQDRDQNGLESKKQLQDFEKYLLLLIDISQHTQTLWVEAESALKKAKKRVKYSDFLKIAEAYNIIHSIFDQGDFYEEIEDQSLAREYGK